MKSKEELAPARVYAVSRKGLLRKRFFSDLDRTSFGY
jgi:hypothetical protein